MGVVDEAESSDEVDNIAGIDEAESTRHRTRVSSAAVSRLSPQASSVTVSRHNPRVSNAAAANMSSVSTSRHSPRVTSVATVKDNSRVVWQERLDAVELCGA